MKNELNKYPLITKLVCVAVVTIIMLPLGQQVFPLFAGAVGGLSFNTMEALLSAGLGYGLYVDDVWLSAFVSRAC